MKRRRKGIRYLVPSFRDAPAQTGSRTLVALLLLIISQLALWPTLEWLQRPLADLPLSISPAGSLETDARIHVRQRYELALDLPNKDGDGRLMDRDALGGASVPPCGRGAHTGGMDAQG